MWREIEEKFARYPAQFRVIKLLLQRGFQVSGGGRVVSGEIEIPHTQIAKEARVDRRVVDATAQTVLKDDMLREIFQHLQPLPFLRDIAPELGLGVIVITAADPTLPGILAGVAQKVAAHDISVRQAITDDPYLVDEPKLTIVTDTPIPSELVDELRDVLGVRSVTIY